MLFVYQPGIGTPASWEKGFSCSCLLEWFAWSKAEETLVEKTLNLDGYKLHKLRFRLEVWISWIFSRIASSWTLFIPCILHWCKPKVIIDVYAKPSTLFKQELYCIIGDFSLSQNLAFEVCFLCAVQCIPSRRLETVIVIYKMWIPWITSFILFFSICSIEYMILSQLGAQMAQLSSVFLFR